MKKEESAYLVLSWNRLADIDASYIAQALKNSACKLRQLSIFSRAMTKIGKKTLQEAANDSCKVSEWKYTLIIKSTNKLQFLSFFSSHFTFQLYFLNTFSIKWWCWLATSIRKIYIKKKCV